MAKSQDRETQEKEKDRKRKDRKALVGRVKKVLKKSRRKLGDEKFEKELQRTIAFIEQLQRTLANSPEKTPSPAKPKPAAMAIPTRSSVKPSARKAVTRAKK